MSQGFTLYDRDHITWLVLITCAGALVLFAARKGGKIRENLKTGAALTAVFFQLFEAGARMLEGTYGLDTLPLHVCALACYGSAVHRFASLKGGPWPYLTQIFFYPMLPGAICALISPDWTMFDAFSPVSIGGFFVHGAITIYIFLCMQEGSIKPDVRKCWVPVVFIFLYAAVMLPFDRHFSMNYGFLQVPSPGSPLMLIAGIFGRGQWYLVGYMLGYTVLMLILYGAAGIISAVLGRCRKEETV